MERRYLVANDYHMSIVKPADRGLVIETLDHAWKESREEFVLEYADRLYDICQDDKQYVHIVYADCFQQLVHARIAPHDSTVIKCKLDGDFTELADLKIACCANRLHLALRFPGRIDHLALSGIHWTKLGSTVTELPVRSIQLVTDGNSLWLAGCMMQQACIWSFDQAAGTWSLLDSMFHLPHTDAQGPVFIQVLPDWNGHLHVMLIHFLHGKLSFHSCAAPEESESAKAAEGSIAIPPARVECAVCAVERERLRFFWLAEESIYRIDYHIACGAWGGLDTVPASHPVAWHIISALKTGSGAAPYWLSDGNHIGSLFQLSGWGVESYRTARNFGQSLRFAHRAIATADSLTRRRNQLHEERERLEQTLQCWQQRKSTLEQRLSVLEEEKNIRRALHVTTVADKLLAKMQAPALQPEAALVKEQEPGKNEVQELNHTHIAETLYQSAPVPALSTVYYPARYEDATQASSFKIKVADLLSKMTKIR
ncbi:hypothetical protein [Paenibacillus apiarius]|uniref:hypothetical protein n=1 Tax=Paenibacillus apiarius TaxID=46240 RepID=UPI003B3A0B50